MVQEALKTMIDLPKPVVEGGAVSRSLSPTWSDSLWRVHASFGGRAGGWTQVQLLPQLSPGPWPSWYLDSPGSTPPARGPRHPTKCSLFGFLLAVSSGVPKGILRLAVLPGGLTEFRKAAMLVVMGVRVSYRGRVQVEISKDKRNGGQVQERPDMSSQVPWPWANRDPLIRQGPRVPLPGARPGPDLPWERAELSPLHLGPWGLTLQFYKLRDTVKWRPSG